MLYKRIGENIRELRIRRRMTQAYLAEQADISISFLGHIERGTRKLSVETLYKIMQALDCSADELLGMLANDQQKKQSAREILRHVMQILNENE